MAVEMFFSEAVKKAFLAFPIGEGGPRSGG